MISLHQEAELAEAPTCKDYLQVRAEGGRQVQRVLRHYNLEAILAVGYRVRSPRGTQFRQWATARLKEYLIKGFVCAGRNSLSSINLWHEKRRTHPVSVADGRTLLQVSRRGMGGAGA